MCLINTFALILWLSLCDDSPLSLSGTSSSALRHEHKSSLLLSSVLSYTRSSTVTRWVSSCHVVLWSQWVCHAMWCCSHGCCAAWWCCGHGHHTACGVVGVMGGHTVWCCRHPTVCGIVVTVVAPCGVVVMVAVIVPCGTAVIGLQKRKLAEKREKKKRKMH